MINNISPVEAKRLVEEENALLVDVREPDEYVSISIEGSHLEPLSALSFLTHDPDKERTKIFHCHSGNRTQDNVKALESRGFSAAYIMEGGLMGWINAGLPVLKRSVPMPMARQIQIVAGFLFFTFTALSFIMPPFRWLALIIGAGLIFAGISGICVMGMLLMRMPWNRKTLQ